MVLFVMYAYHLARLIIMRASFSVSRIAAILESCNSEQSGLKCPYDQIVGIPFFTFSYTVRLPRISCQISIYYEVYSARFLGLYFCESTAAINFPCSNSWLKIGENDVIFSKIPHGLRL